jgi:hypothetical protein
MRPLTFLPVLLTALLLSPSNALAVRPFVTDDARIISKGQIEVESWPELNSVGDEHTYAFQGMFGYSVNEWFELIVGSGVGYDRRPSEITVNNPVIMPKFLLYAAELESFMPGIAIGLGTSINWGRGSLYDNATGRYAIVMASWRFWDDWLNIHLNLGERASRIERQNFSSEYWGIGFDVGVIHRDYRLIVEAYAGDPIEPIAPDIAYQWGGRWLKSDYVNFDITMGTQREPIGFGQGGAEREYWIQFGIRLLFDTELTTDPRPDGARGLFRRG